MCFGSSGPSVKVAPPPPPVPAPAPPPPAPQIIQPPQVFLNKPEEKKQKRAKRPSAIRRSNRGGSLRSKMIIPLNTAASGSGTLNV